MSYLFKGKDGRIFASVLIALVGMMVVFIWAAQKSRNEFMAECTQDGKKQYECTAMWRSGQSSSTFVPVIIPTR